MTRGMKSEVLMSTQVASGEVQKLGVCNKHGDLTLGTTHKTTRCDHWHRCMHMLLVHRRFG